MLLLYIALFLASVRSCLKKPVMYYENVGKLIFFCDTENFLQLSACFVSLFSFNLTFYGLQKFQ